MKWKLYHRISDPGSARVRKFISDNALSEYCQYANIEVGERDLRELQQFSVSLQVPSLRVLGGAQADQAQAGAGEDLWIAGADEILEFLKKRS